MISVDWADSGSANLGNWQGRAAAAALE